MSSAFQSIEPRLPVKDPRRSLEFYRQLLGAGSGGSVSDADGFALLRTEKIGLQFVKGSPSHPPRPQTFWIDCRDLAAVHLRIREDFVIEWGPENYSYGRREFAVLDPDGHRIIFSEPVPG